MTNQDVLLALKKSSEAHEVFVHAFDDVDPRDSYDDMTGSFWWANKYWVVFADTREGVLWGKAYSESNNDPILDTPEPDHGSMPILGFGKPAYGVVGLTCIVADYQDGHGYANCVFDDSKRIA